MKRKYVQVIRKMDDSKFQKLPRQGYCVENNDQLYNNLWSMFTLKYSEYEMRKMDGKKLCSTPGCCVADYAWTREVEEAFYNHPLHVKYIKLIRKRNVFGWWCLQCEPSSVEE